MHNAVFFALAFLAGIMALQWLPQLPDWPWLTLTIIVVLAAFIRTIRLPCLVLLGVFWSGFLAQSQLDHQLPSSLEGVDLEIIGLVVGLPQSTDRSVRFLMQIESSSSHRELAQQLRRVSLRWYQTDTSPLPGETWRMTVRLKQPHGFSNPFGFDYEGWLFHQGIDATGYVRNRPLPERLRTTSVWCVDCWRLKIAQRLTALLPNLEHPETMLSLMIGDRRGITQQQWHALQMTGTSHLFAISGLHIGLIAALVFLGMRSLIRCVGRGSYLERQLCAIGAIGVAGLYALLAGFAVPAQRAWVMVTIVMFAMISQRHIRVSHGFAVALIAILTMDPFAVHSVGFWLSFSAVGLLIWVGSGRFRSMGFAQGLAHAQWVLAIGLLPMLIWFFQMVPLWMAVANLFAVPWVSFVVVPLLMLVHILMWLVPVLAVPVMKLVDLSIDLLWQWLALLESIRLPEWSILVASWPAYALACVGVLWLFSPRGFPARHVAWLLFVPALFPAKTVMEKGEFRLTLLDVGQGLSTVIETQNHVLLYDTGARWSDRFSAVEMVVTPYLRGRGYDHIDTLIISHGDNDHAGGADDLLGSWTIHQTRTSVPERFNAHAVEACETGQNWVWDDVRFEILHPESHDFLTGNNASCVLRISTADKRVLLTGDIEQLVETRLVEQYGETLASDLLIAPHHGSISSSSEVFLNAVSPKWVLFPVGYQNRFGFPDQRVLKRYWEQGSNTFDTATSGALSALVSPVVPIKIESHRFTHRRYWHWTPDDSR